MDAEGEGVGTMTKVQYGRMIKLANEISNDNEKWDYSWECWCVIPRFRRLFPESNPFSTASWAALFGINSDYRKKWFLNDNRRSALGRKAVANRFKQYAKKHFKGAK